MEEEWQGKVHNREERRGIVAFCTCKWNENHTSGLYCGASLVIQPALGLITLPSVLSSEE